MFNFFEMEGNYEDRKVGHDNFDWGFISTAYVNDGDKDYETAIAHKDYNNGSMVIVENYDTKVLAEAGHKKWIETMTSDQLPEELNDCNNSGVQQLASAFGDDTKYPRKKSA